MQSMYAEYMTLAELTSGVEHALMAAGLTYLDLEWSLSRRGNDQQEAGSAPDVSSLGGCRSWLHR